MKCFNGECIEISECSRVSRLFPPIVSDAAQDFEITESSGD